MIISTIKSANDLRAAYVRLHVLQDIEKTGKADLRSLILQQKVAIRTYARRAQEYPRGIRGDFDSCVILDKLPGYIKTEAEAVAYFERACYTPAPCSSYDCTGKAFTTRYKVFQRRGAWYVYHFMARDV